VGFAFFLDFWPRTGPWYNARLRASTVALTDSVALVDAAVGIFAKFLMNFKAALTSSAVLSGGSLGTVLGRLLSSELDRERERFGIIVFERASRHRPGNHFFHSIHPSFS